ncbi:MAG TPA: hypothetical protein VFZ78_09710 [Flavisolibacter sp.]
MKQLKIALSLGALAVTLFAMQACNKDIETITPPEAAHFGLKSNDTYFITSPTTSKSVYVGLTNVSNTDRTVNITVTSPTGAQLGTHYTLSSTSVTIPAGKALDSIVVQGIYSQYLTGRKDTLVFTITEPGVPASSFNSTLKLYMRGPCFEGEINTDYMDLLGNYNTTNEVGYTASSGATAWTYGPYATKIKSITLTSPTTANVVIGGLYDPSWSDATVTLDWTNINDRRITLATQVIGDAGTVNSAYAGQPLTIGPILSTQNPQPIWGTFNFCANTLSLKFRMCIPNLGCFGYVVVENMAR